MFTQRGSCARIVAAAVTVSLGLASAGPVLAGSASIRPNVTQAIAAGTIDVLHSFAGSDGSNPQGGLQYGFRLSGSTVQTAIFGTTQTGGTRADGTIFEQNIRADKAFTSAFAFRGVNGAAPAGGLSGAYTNYSFSGPVYGVTATGGAKGFGAIYEATKDGQTVLYSFTGWGDGANPAGRLIYSDNALYGTTTTGAKGYGTIFRFSAKSGLQTLHVFSGGNDGGKPLAGLALRLNIPASASKARSAALSGRTIDARRAGSSYVDKDFYGTTSTGGAAGLGNGTLFKVSCATGVFTTLYTFTDSATAPGANPAAELATDFDGNLYGTTANGGSAGFGEVFEYGADSRFRVIHDFGVDYASGIAATGANPLAALTVAFNGALYGTTSSGSRNGLGNVFEISGAGFALKYEFAGPDGASPQSPLVDGLDGNLYGTTYAGGANGQGEIFAIGE